MLELLNNPWILAAALIIGLVLLVKGADLLVDGASGLAKRFGISDLVIGLTVVAFGTSMPEFVVNMVSVADGATDLAITNILGSNIINTFVILGLTAIIYPVAAKHRSIVLDIPMSCAGGVLIFIMVVLNIGYGGNNGITRAEGIALLACFVFFLYSTFRHTKDNTDEAEEVKPMKTWKAIVFIIIGLVGLVVGGEMIVKSAVKIATDLGVGEAIVGLTIVALGTSLPELATSVVAAIKKNTDIALGNVIGSNIFNVFLVLGTSATVRTLPAYSGLWIDALMAALGSLLVLLFVFTNKEREVKRWGGAVLLLVYAGYLTYRLLTV